MLSRFKGYSSEFFSIKVIDREPNKITLKIRYTPLSWNVSLTYPTLEGNIFEEQGIYRYIPWVYLLKKSSLEKEQFTIPDDFIKMSPLDVIEKIGLVNNIKIIAANAARRCPPNDEMQRLVDNAWRGFRQVSQIPRIWKPSISPNKVLILTPGVEPLDLRGRIPFIKVNDPSIDISSVAISGGNAGMVADLKIRDDQKFGGKLECALFPEHTRKLVGCRTNFENSMELVRPEEPIVKAKKNSLSGVNLFTVVATGKYNLFDAVMVSESAAARLAAFKIFTFPFQSGEVLVSVGDKVRKGHLLVDHPETPVIFRAPYNGTVIEIGMDRIRIKVLYPFKTGDKIFTRTGHKTVAKVVSDSEMPNVNGKKAEVLVDPIGLLDRRNFAFFMEMEQSSGKKSYYGHVFYIRVDSNASDMMITNEHSSKFHMIQDRTSSGNRFNLTNLLVLQEKHKPKNLVDWISKYRELGYVDMIIGQLSGSK